MIRQAWLLSEHQAMPHLVAYIDGGSLGNPGSSGIGVVIDGPADGEEESHMSHLMCDRRDLTVHVLQSDVVMTG
jgi:hypothetical protein